MSSTLKDELKGVRDAGLPDWAHIYGEIQYRPALQLFLDYPENFKKGKIFYDLGSGTGKIPSMAFLRGMKATGVEFSEARHKISCDAVKKIDSDHSTGSLNMDRGNFLKYDFSDADIVFSNAIMFNEEMMAGLSNIARGLKPGAIIISSKVPDYHVYTK